MARLELGPQKGGRMTLLKKRFPTPIGEVTLIANPRALVGLVWDEGELPRLGLAAALPGANGPLDAGESQLGEFFAGKRIRFELPLEPAGSDFQRLVWDRLREIPFGSTWSYRELALRVGNPGAARAVGSANGRNPLCILIPCHRVVKASGEIGGYAGGTERKAFLLGLEGAAPKA
jgi:methylated-DNA-[protein]-cysteine S-methyltransferase